MIHAVAAMVMAGHQWLFYRAECGEMNSAYHANILLFSVSYFNYDFVCMWYEGILDKAMTIHHLLCIFGLLIPVYEN